MYSLRRNLKQQKMTQDDQCFHVELVASKPLVMWNRANTHRSFQPSASCTALPQKECVFLFVWSLSMGLSSPLFSRLQLENKSSPEKKRNGPLNICVVPVVCCRLFIQDWHQTFQLLCFQSMGVSSNHPNISKLDSIWAFFNPWWLGDHLLEESFLSFPQVPSTPPHRWKTSAGAGRYFDLVQRLSLLEKFECTNDLRVRSLVFFFGVSTGEW